LVVFIFHHNLCTPAKGTEREEANHRMIEERGVLEWIPR